MPAIQKKPHELAVDAFEDADRAYKELEAKVVSGEFIDDLAPNSLDYAARQRMKEQWVILWNQLRQLLDERNTRFTEAQTQMRAALAPDLSKEQKWRMNGKADRLAYGKLEANTRTKRFFIGTELVKHAAAHGLLNQLKELTYLDEKTGERRPAIEETIEVKFKPVMEWLQDRQLDVIINQAYEEIEETPMVSGDKRIAFLGQKVDK
jgi:hypothetical protein